MNIVKLIKTSTDHRLIIQVEKLVKEGYTPRYESLRIVKDNKGKRVFYMFMDQIPQLSIAKVFSTKNKEHLEQLPRRR